jgi:2-polyprenyl-3-methyl-5-hydroxy-6-metoxy-1,4-benzoquinol methylase
MAAFEAAYYFAGEVMKAELTTPVAFLIFNRPQLTKKVFEAIAQVKPKTLLVVADGPRSLEEIEKCQKARSVIEKVDWDCEVSTNFSDVNLGCRNRISTGLDWVFSKVEEAIIVEDDCLPNLSFFYFCQFLLEYYRTETQVMHISGNNFQFGQQRTPYSYYFSKYCHNWGWATWRRAWQHYDVKMENWKEFRDSGALQSIFTTSQERDYWTYIFNQTFEHQIDTWDYQWLYTCWTKGGLAVLPEVNLVSNIGFSDEATHTYLEDSLLSNIPTEPLNFIEHPRFLNHHVEADLYTFNQIFGGQLSKASIESVQATSNQYKEQQQQLQVKLENMQKLACQLQNELQQVQIQKSQTSKQLEQVKSRKQQFIRELHQLQSVFSETKLSKFWKLREKWINLKQKLRFGRSLTMADSTRSLDQSQNPVYPNHSQERVITSPLTGSSQVTLLKTIDAAQFIQDWKDSFQIDITEELHNYSEFYLYQCDRTKLKFFVPTDITGSENLYKQLERFEWYYMADKWEYRVALKDLKPGLEVLEIGSGRGYFIKLAMQKGLAARGIELNSEAVAIAQANELPVEVLDLKEAAHRYTNCFDAVCSFQVLEHIPNPKDFINQCLDLLKPNGRIIFCVPNSESFLQYQYCLLDMPPHHMLQWSKATFQSLEDFFPIKLEKVIYEPLASYHVKGYLYSYHDHFRSQKPLGKVLFNQHTLPLYEKFLNTGFNKFFKGQSLYVQFRKC